MIISCIGSGNMGTALMKGAAAAAAVIGFTDADKPRANAAAVSIGGQVFASNTEAAEKGDFIFLAVKPQDLEDVLEEITPVLSEKKQPFTLVSMAAGWSIERIQTVLASGQKPCLKAPVVRIMPNTPSLICRGVIVMAPSPEVSVDQIAVLKKILSGAGLVDCLEERYMDAVTGLSGSGPAFVYLFIEALADGGVRAGLPRDKALNYAAQTVLGSAAMVLDTGKHPGELKDMVTSPGGTTIAGVTALENNAFRAAVINAVEAAWRRAAEL